MKHAMRGLGERGGRSRAASDAKVAVARGPSPLLACSGPSADWTRTARTVRPPPLSNVSAILLRG